MPQPQTNHHLPNEEYPPQKNELARRDRSSASEECAVREMRGRVRGALLILVEIGELCMPNHRFLKTVCRLTLSDLRAHALVVHVVHERLALDLLGLPPGDAYLVQLAQAVRQRIQRRYLAVVEDHAPTNQCDEVVGHALWQLIIGLFAGMMTEEASLRVCPLANV